MKSLSIVIPAYNEEANVHTTIAEVSGVADQLGLDYEIILVNDGSHDRTGQIGRDLARFVHNFRLVEHYPNRGYGGALKAGFAAARKELIAFFPANNQFHFEEITRLLERHDETNAEVICGYRTPRRDPFMRKFNAFGWNMLIRILFGYLCRDIDCGFKLFQRDLLHRISIESDGALIDTEFLSKARRLGHRIEEVPVPHRPRVGGEATGANLHVIVKAFRDLWTLLQKQTAVTGYLKWRFGLR